MKNYLKYGDSNYVKKPYTKINYSVNFSENNEKIVKQINKLISECKQQKFNIAFEYYYGVNQDEIRSSIIDNLNISNAFDTSLVKKSELETLNMLSYWLTDDRIFGKMTYFPLIDFFDKSKYIDLKKITCQSGVNLVYGVGASLFIEADLIVYFDLNRWEIQTRQRNGQDNWNAKNFNDDPKTKYKRSYFIEWRSLDEHKRKIFNKINYFVDANHQLKFLMLEGNDYRRHLSALAKQPFRVEPFFDPGVWGGQWMKQIMDLDKEKINYAWCFDFVVEENSLNFNINDTLFNTPAINTVLYQPEKFLGEKVYCRFGAEWPIRSDLLDCMEGQNLSLHVHPLLEYAYKNYGIHYTQDETYYILDGEEDQSVYLGFKNNVILEELEKDLKNANYKNQEFRVEKYINKFNSKKHDHFLIPAGTPHCAGKDTMVLEISANPYIFTLRMWDWGRLDFDGKPRSIKIDEALENIQLKFNEKYTNEILYKKPIILSKKDNSIHELTANSNREFIRTERITFKDKYKFSNNGNFSLIHLVEGPSIEIYSENGEFEPFELHYAEVVALPAGITEYSIKNNSNYHENLKVLKSYVDFS